MTKRDKFSLLILKRLKQIVQHNLNYKVDGQGGLLEILKNKEDIYICYTEDRNSGKTSTSIAKAKYSRKNLNFKIFFKQILQLIQDIILDVEW